MKLFGMALVVLGVVALAAGGLGYDRQKTVFQVGGLKATATEHSTVPYVPILGIISAIGGIALVLTARRTSPGGR